MEILSLNGHASMWSAACKGKIIVLPSLIAGSSRIIEAGCLPPCHAQVRLVKDVQQAGLRPKPEVGPAMRAAAHPFEADNPCLRVTCSVMRRGLVGPGPLIHPPAFPPVALPGGRWASSSVLAATARPPSSGQRAPSMCRGQSSAHSAACRPAHRWS